MKCGTAQKMVLNMLSTCTMVKLGKVYGNLMVDVKPSNEKLVHRCISIVREATGADEKTAVAALEECGYKCKTAIVMLLCAVDAGEAEARLGRNDGRVADAILNKKGNAEQHGVASFDYLSYITSFIPHDDRVSLPLVTEGTLFAWAKYRLVCQYGKRERLLLRCRQSPVLRSSLPGTPAAAADVPHESRVQSAPPPPTMSRAGSSGAKPVPPRLCTPAVKRVAVASTSKSGIFFRLGICANGRTYSAP